jgi:hypothetical protein
MARTKKEVLKESLKVVSVKLTPTLEKTLQQLGQEASDRLGWTVSGSAILRALVSYAGQQPGSWTVSELLPLIEQEIALGRVWGSKKQGI